MQRSLFAMFTVLSCLAAGCSAGVAPAAPAAGGGPAQTSAAAAADASPIYFGVSAPLTGPLAEYGGYFQQGFGLALEELNGAGGVSGHPIELVWADTQSDPKQSVPVAQKFVDDPKIIAELGDFSSTASMAASPVYERAKVVQYGYTNSSPVFTNGGQYMWSPSVSQASAEVLQTDAVAKYGKRVAVLYLGQLMEIGPRATVIEEPRHPYTQALIASIPSLIPGEGITRELIHGEITDQAPPPGGCVFAPRCALRERLGNPEICLTTRPTLQLLAEDHGAACHFAERADDIATTSLHNTGSLRP